MDSKDGTQSESQIRSSELVRRKMSYRQFVSKELGTDDICILLAWQRMAIRLGELWNAHIRLAKEHGDKVIPGTEATGVVFGSCLGNGALKFMSREHLQHLS